MIAEYLTEALNKLVEQDKHLLLYDVNERSITHKLAEYLQPLFNDRNVDCEYNRNGYDPKALNDLPPKKGVHAGEIDDPGATTIYPDIIVHRRGDNDHNLLVVEVKKSNNMAYVDFDISKLRECRRQLGYQNAAFIVFRIGPLAVDVEPYTVQWIETHDKYY